MENDIADEPHIVLFFDVNKTVIMHDPVQGKGLDHILNDLLTERAFGSVSADGETWTWNREPVVVIDPSVSPLDVTNTSSHEDDGAAPTTISYGAFLRAKYPMSSDASVSKHNKKMRKILRQDFTSPGNPGEGFAHDHVALLERLRLPATTSTTTGLHEPQDALLVAAGLEDSPYHFIIPSFFKFIQFLHDRGTSFNLVFRTFGDDLDRIAQEFNLFCSGKHPFFTPGSTLLDGSGGSIDRRLYLSSTPRSLDEAARYGTFYRSEKTTALVLGTLKQPPCVNDSFQDFYCAIEETVDVVHGVEKIHGFLTNQWRTQQATLAIRDFYPFWFSKLEDPHAGKLMTVDLDDPSVHCLFFDDNILPNEPHIVDARSYPSQEPLPWEKVKELFLMRVEPLEAVREEEYFIRRYLESLEKRKAQRSSV